MKPESARPARLPRVPPAVWLVMLAAAGVFALTMGARMSMGLFVGSINTATGLGLASVSLAFAFGQLWWGLTQPIGGLVADRVGAGRVLVVGIVLVAVGTALIPHMQTTAGLVFAIGVLSAGGAGIAGPAVLMSATARLVPPERRGFATGVVNAGGSFGQFVFAPVAAGLTALAGWAVAVQSLALIALLALPAAWVLRGSHRDAAASAPSTAASAAPPPRTETTRELVARAARDRSLRLLAAGFFVCGFHVAFLGTHLPGVVEWCGLPPSVGAWSLAMIGFFNIVGSFAIGWAIGHRGGLWPMKHLLAAIYALRGLAVLAFVFAPKTPTVMLLFAAVMGLTFLSTVPPTAGLVAKLFGAQNLGLLFGLVMVTHQMGGFLGAYLGGKAFEASGHYDWMWAADIALAFAAALLHLPIREPRPAAAVAPAPAR